MAERNLSLTKLSQAKDWVNEANKKGEICGEREERRQERVEFTWGKREREMREAWKKNLAAQNLTWTNMSCLKTRAISLRLWAPTPFRSPHTITQSCVSSCPSTPRHPLPYNHLNSSWLISLFPTSPPTLPNTICISHFIHTPIVHFSV